MTTQVTLKEILKKAIQREVDSRQLYINLSQRVRDEAAKDVFQKLAQYEQTHQTLLEQYLRGELKEGSLSSDHIVDYKIAEHLDHPDISPEMNLQETFLLAANREKLAHEFYLALSEIHPEGEVQRLLEGLAIQELEHKQKVEFIYTEVAFPQLDGG